LESENPQEGKDPMAAKWGICVLLLGLLALTAGCRTPQPNLKPEPTAQQFNAPPAGYETAGLPKRAFDAPSDPVKFGIDAKGPGTMPTRGGMGNGMGGMGGVR